MIKYIMIAAAAVGVSTVAHAQVTDERLNQIMIEDALPFLIEHETTSFISEATVDELPTISCSTLEDAAIMDDGRSDALVLNAVWSWVDWAIEVDCNVEDDILLKQTVVHEMVHWVQSWNVLLRKPSDQDRERLGGMWFAWYPCLAAVEGMAYGLQFMYHQSDDLNDAVLENLLAMVNCETDALQPYFD